MKRNVVLFILLTLICLCTTSCQKDPFDIDIDEYVTVQSNGGDDKKIDIKGSLMNGDMKHPNIEAWISENNLYFKFNETVENCMILVTTSGGRVVFSRRVAKQYPMSVRIYMGDKPSGDYHLYITDSIKEAEGLFHFENVLPIKQKYK